MDCNSHYSLFSSLGKPIRKVSVHFKSKFQSTVIAILVKYLANLGFNCAYSLGYYSQGAQYYEDPSKPLILQ